LEENVITSELLEAYLACPMKCYLRSSGEKCSENKFFVWYETQKESYRRVGARRLEASVPQELIRNQIAPRDFRKAQWQLALNQVLDTDDLSASIHAIQRIPKEGRLSEFIAWLASELKSMGIQRSIVFGQTHHQTNRPFGLTSLQLCRPP
jgi:hypothetical protein